MRSDPTRSLGQAQSAESDKQPKPTQLDPTDQTALLARSPRLTTLARLAGFGYLVLFVSGSFTLFVRGSLIDRTDAALSLARIAEAKTLFGLGVVAELTLAAAWLVVAYLLFRVFRPTSRHAASLLLLFAAAGVAVICANAVFQAALLALAREHNVLAALESPARETIAALLQTFIIRGWTVASLWTGLWLVPLGLAVITSNRIPKFLGVVLIVGCFGYLAPMILVLLLPDATHWNLGFMSISGLAEITFGLWLLARGLGPSRSTA